jgi:hypothetical protein
VMCALLCALSPSRHMCNGLLCRSFRTVSESFGLVRGRACVCGCCVGEAAGGHTCKVHGFQAWVLWIRNATCASNAPQLNISTQHCKQAT